jgi:glycine/D-amino acid oxidase-like deaminating enzyme/nitrite reductase/ring-hydroxylating ferredoxin subunit
MDPVSGRTRSLWMYAHRLPARPRLTRDVRFDVCVVGAGIAGLSTAYLLTRAGRRVIVVDDGPIAGGETCRTTAHLSTVIDDHYYEIERLHGSLAASICADSHAAAIDRIESTVRRERIECGFERLNAYLFAPPGEDVDELERELYAARRAGIHDAILVDRAPMDRFDTGRCLRFPRQGQLDPIPYLHALMNAIERGGGAVHCDTHVTQVRSGSTVAVQTEAGPVIEASDVVIATNTPVHTRLRFHTKQAAYRTYVVALTVPRGSVARALYYDTLEPYHYVRLAPAPASQGDDDEVELLLVGGEDHKTGQEHDAVQRWEALEWWARERFLSAEDVAYRWSGQVMEPVDGVAFIGRDPHEPHTYLVTGDSGMGMTHGTIGGILITDLITGRSNKWVSLYDPGRISLRSAARFARENVNVAAHYTDLITPGEVEAVDEIPPCQGALLRDGAKKLAVYRDESGEARAFSAICPHLGCVVAWNSAERTWDCPCHGSRFDAIGRVLNGPANRDLSDEALPEQPVRRTRDGGKRRGPTPRGDGG